MSVDCTARVIYGWLMTNDEIYDLEQRCENKDQYWDKEYLWTINGYSRDTDYVYGINLASTDYVQFIDPDLMSYNWDDDEDWLDCTRQFKEDFPDKYDNVKPGFFLVCNWW
jgi:hypothetical protein